MIHPARVEHLNSEPDRPGDRVVYWMQQSQRVACNQALEFAIHEANRLHLPLHVVFGVTPSYPEANARHYAFMLEGLRDVRDSLAARGIGFVLRIGSPDEVALRESRDAALLVADRGYLRHQVGWRERVARESGRRVVQVEADVVVPCALASGGEEYSARTIRPKLLRRLAVHLSAGRESAVAVCACRDQVDEVGLHDVERALYALGVDASVKPADWCRGGEREARQRLDEFIAGKLPEYAERRNDPAEDGGSTLAPYLHFGQISPIEVALAVREQGGAGPDAFLEELLVRRELSVNFVVHNRGYDSYASAVPRWARETLDRHRLDPRPYVYTRNEMESAMTHDDAWNAAQREMVSTGRMHGYMRMYWAKKIIEWTVEPEIAYNTILEMNNRYFLDGRDVNSYANIAWSFGRFDRPWPARPVFGSIRSMTEAGLRRKFDVDAYRRRVDALTAPSSEAKGNRPKST